MPLAVSICLIFEYTYNESNPRPDAIIILRIGEGTVQIKLSNSPNATMIPVSLKSVDNKKSAAGSAKINYIMNT